MALRFVLSVLSEVRSGHFGAPGFPYPVVIVEDDVRGGERGVAAEVHLDLAGEPPAR